MSGYSIDLTDRIIDIQGRYLEGGRFGDVYKCLLKNTSDTKEVAVKAFRFKLVLEGEGVDGFAESFREGLHSWRRLTHGNIVPFLGVAYGFGMQNSTSFVSLWMPNGNLQGFLAKYDGNLITTHRLYLLRDIANGLHYLHTQSPPVIHGDLHSNNVLFDAEYTVRLSDYGYSSSVEVTPEALAYLRRSPTTSESLRWIAPEQVLCDSGEKFRKTIESDVYVFGNIALHARPHDASAGQYLINLQALSGTQPWAEIREDASIVLCLAQGQKPGRPRTRPIDDQHWEFINICWSLIQKHRPTSMQIVSVIKSFLDQHPSVQSIRDLVASLS